MCKDSFANYEDFGVYASADTPPDRHTTEYVDLSLSSSIHLPTMHGKEHHTQPIDVDFTDGIDESLDAAIMASIIEGSKGGGAEDIIDLESQGTFDEDVKQAIALSLKDQ